MKVECAGKDEDEGVRLRLRLKGEGGRRRIRRNLEELRLLSSTIVRRFARGHVKILMYNRYESLSYKRNKNILCLDCTYAHMHLVIGFRELSVGQHDRTVMRKGINSPA